MFPLRSTASNPGWCDSSLAGFSRRLRLIFEASPLALRDVLIFPSTDFSRFVVVVSVAIHCDTVPERCWGEGGLVAVSRGAPFAAAFPRGNLVRLFSAFCKRSAESCLWRVFRRFVVVSGAIVNCLTNVPCEAVPFNQGIALWRKMIPGVSDKRNWNYTRICLRKRWWPAKSKTTAFLARAIFEDTVNGISVHQTVFIGIGRAWTVRVKRSRIAWLLPLCLKKLLAFVD